MTTKQVNLWQQHLGVVPEDVYAQEDVEVLILAENPLAHLPASLFALPRLEKLDLRWTPPLPSDREIDALESRGCVVYR